MAHRREASADCPPRARPRVTCSATLHFLPHTVAAQGELGPLQVAIPAKCQQKNASFSGEILAAPESPAFLGHNPWNFSNQLS
jgi:hypothetical protein